MFFGVLASLIFGFEFFFMAQALDEIQPFQLLAYQFLLSGLTMSVLKWVGLIKVDLRKPGFTTVLILSILQPVLFYILETVGLEMTSTIIAGILMAVIPVVVMVLAIFLLREYPTVIQFAAGILTFLGVVLVTVMAGSEGGEGNLLGLVVLLAAVLIYGYYTVLTRKIFETFTPVEVTYVMMWFGGIVFNLIAIGLSLTSGTLPEYFAPLAQGKVLVAVFYLGVVALAAFFIGNYLIAQIGPARMSVFANLTTIVTVIAGVLLRHDHFYWYHAVGAGMIILGVYICNRPQDKVAKQ